jgi:hydrogen peroxide-dependent heme synthase
MSMAHESTMAQGTTTQGKTTDLAAVPLVLDGSPVLHQMFRVRWAAWQEQSPEERKRILNEAAPVLAEFEADGYSAIFSMLGHKADLMFVHFRESFDALNEVELRLANLKLNQYLEPTTSYVSMVELGLYESTVKLYRSFAERGVQPHSEEWNKEVEELMERQRQAMRPRLFPKVPGMRYACFYPMDRRRGEMKNWYVLPIEDRQRQMEEHGAVGRRYAGRVQQIISGSIGFDDWEWGVDLFSNEPSTFKKLIYEMRFDQVSAEYSNFGTFYLGVRVPAAQFGELISGKLPEPGTK